MIKLTDILREVFDDVKKYPVPFDGISVINREPESDIYQFFSEQYDLPDEPILYIHSFFPKKEYKGRGITKKYLLHTLSSWARGVDDVGILAPEIGMRFIRQSGGSRYFGTSSMYSEGEGFFNKLVSDGYLERVQLTKRGGGRELILFKITDKTIQEYR